MPKLAIIGGTGVYDPSLLTNLRNESITTQYGEVTFTIGEYCGKKVVFMNRHGKGHALPPHKVNYKGNIWALKTMGVERVVATAAVGSLNKEMAPGSMILCDQFIDFTKGRSQTFYEDGENGVVHVDMTEPYCKESRSMLLESAQRAGLEIINGGTYLCTEGPRFETPAEIRMFKLWGADVIGMTGVPEVILAREAEICYASLAVVTNYAAGISMTPLTHAEVLAAMKEAAEKFHKLITTYLEIVPEDRSCLCKTAIEELGSLG